MKLPGHDAYKLSHILYLDDLHRDFGAVRLNIEALKAFHDTVIVRERKALAVERRTIAEWQAGGAPFDEFPSPSAESSRFLEYRNYENLKIAAGFELHAKARLLAKNFVIHDVDKRSPGCATLAADQRKRPIAKHELFAVTGYHFNGTHNYLPALKQSSLLFSLITDKAAYRAALDLTARQVEIIKDFRLLRNEIHLPGEGVETPTLSSLGMPVIDVLLPFINTEIVEWSNRLIELHGFRFRPLQAIEP